MWISGHHAHGHSLQIGTKPGVELASGTKSPPERVCSCPKEPLGPLPQAHPQTGGHKALGSAPLAPGERSPFLASLEVSLPLRWGLGGAVSLCPPLAWAPSLLGAVCAHHSEPQTGPPHALPGSAPPGDLERRLALPSGDHPVPR